MSTQTHDALVHMIGDFPPSPCEQDYMRVGAGTPHHPAHFVSLQLEGFYPGPHLGLKRPFSIILMRYNRTWHRHEMGTT